MSDDIKIVNETKVGRVVYYANGIRVEEEVQYSITRHERPDGTNAHVIVRPPAFKTRSSAPNEKDG